MKEQHNEKELEITEITKIETANVEIINVEAANIEATAVENAVKTDTVEFDETSLLAEDENGEDENGDESSEEDAEGDDENGLTAHETLIAAAAAEGHKAGFVNIIGLPNVGKSTLMNALVGERMSIISNKPQTTRHRLVGILSADNHQVVFSDTPGYIEQPHYKMQERMNSFVNTTFEDGDLLLLVIDSLEPVDQFSEALLAKLEKCDTPVFLLLNKSDLCTESSLKLLENKWLSRYAFDKVFYISALKQKNTDILLAAIIDEMPTHPAFYPKDQLTDRPERFFVSEIVREKILDLYHQEIPYSCEVAVHTFKEDEEKNLVRIYAYILVTRQSQKNIIIGKGGQSIKQLGIAARQAIETFLEKKVFIELIVKVRDNWRDDETALRNFGYDA
jgi:GTP-binding protein Era